MRIPTKSYLSQYQAIWGEVSTAIERAIFTDDPILGEAVERFENELARYHDVKHAVGVGSGTDAMVLLLKELGFSADDEIITCSHTFSGVISAILLAGAKPVLCDANPITGLLDAERLQMAFTKRTKAVVAVHLYGHPVDLDAIGELCAKRGVLLLEDASQAHGARWRGRGIGSFGKATILSFHPSKNLGAFGDGGAIVTSDTELAAGLRIARNLGKHGKYEFGRISTNSKLDTLQAAILAVKLRHLNEWIEQRRSLASRYIEGLQNVGDLVLPCEDSRAHHAYHLFVVRTAHREALRGFLASHGIDTSLHYPIAAHRQPALQAYFALDRFPVAEQLAAQVLTLPLSHEHRSCEIDEVIARVRDYFGE
jgi:dTDP-3-amino-3,4,6-trideoxy-alpha-D-glucose transaminase